MSLEPAFDGGDDEALVLLVLTEEVEELGGGEEVGEQGYGELPSIQ